MLDGLPRPRGATDSILKEVGLTCLWTNILKGARAKGAGCTLIPDTEDRDAEVERLVKLGAYPWRHKPGSDFVVLEGPNPASATPRERLPSDGFIESAPENPAHAHRSQAPFAAYAGHAINPGPWPP
jgi:hypothetical protein